MKTIKIFALPSHQTKERTSGVDYARVIQPMTFLNGYKDDEVEFKVDLFDIEKNTDWLYVAQNYDIIYLNYIANTWAFAAMGSMARKFGVKIVLDLDDSLWNIRSDNPAHSVYHKGSQALKDFTSICNEVDLMTTTSSYLKHVIMNNTRKKPEQIKVIPNYIDLDFYSHRSPFKDDGRIVLTHYGSTTHFIDLSDDEFFKGIDRIMKEYPQVSLRCVGAFLPKLKKRWGQRYEQCFGHMDIKHWVQDKDMFPKFMDETDILVVPLDEDIYNKAKSNIKYLEASSAKIPGVYQRIRQYSETIMDGENGYLANTANQWYLAIKEMIDDPKKRQAVGEAAFKEVEENYQMKDHIHEYAKVFKDILS